MPLYEYRCKNCGNRFEIRRPIAAIGDPTECPSCASEDVTRQVSLFMTLGRDADSSPSAGGCGCGGACACGGHNLN